MSATTFKHTPQLILLLLLLMVPVTLYSQNQERSRSINLVVGGGIGHYFNTFTNVLDEDVRNNRPAFSGKLLWQTEYLLRLGFESGYYFVYSTTRVKTNSGSEKLTSNLKVVPIFLSISMKVINHFEINFGTGWAKMIYTVNASGSKQEKIVGNTYSMSNYTAGFTYSYPLRKNLDLGSEFKYLYFGKTDDSYCSVLLTISYKILWWNVR